MNDFGGMLFADHSFEGLWLVIWRRIYTQHARFFELG